MAKTTHPSDTTYDLIIVGAGPAGSSAALSALAENPNMSVIVVDAQPIGRDKVCGDALGSDTLLALAKLGQHNLIQPEERVSSFLIEDTKDNRVSGTPPTPGFVIPRKVFDKRMITAAINNGATFHHNRVVELCQTPTKVTLTLKNGIRIHAKTLIAADGANSKIRHLIQAPPNTNDTMAIAVRGYADNTSKTDTLHIIWDDDAQAFPAYAWAFPTAEGRINVGYGTTVSASLRGNIRVTGKTFLIEKTHDMLSKIINTDNIKFSGHRLPLSTFRPKPAWGNVLLTGDAASLINPLSGEGIYYAILSGTLAGKAVSHQQKPGQAYAKALNDNLSIHHRQVKQMTKMINISPKFISAAIRAAQHDEKVFDTLLQVSLGSGYMSTKDTIRFINAWRKTL